MTLILSNCNLTKKVQCIKDNLRNDGFYSGRLLTTPYTYGLIVAAALAGTSQTFNQEYGIVVDAYATGVSTTPSDVIRLDAPRGTSLHNLTADESAMLWYKGTLDDTPTEQSELWLNDVFVTVLKRKVLSLCYNHDYSGRDVAKSKLLDMIFKSECAAIKRMFQRV